MLMTPLSRVMQIEANGASDANEESNLLSTPAEAPAALAQSSAAATPMQEDILVAAAPPFVAPQEAGARAGQPSAAAAAAAVAAVAAAAAAAAPAPSSAVKMTPELADELTVALNVHITARNSRNSTKQAVLTVFSSWKPKTAKQTELYEVVARLLPAEQVKNAAGKTTGLKLQGSPAARTYSVEQLKKLIQELLPDTRSAQTGASLDTVVSYVLAEAQSEMRAATDAASAAAAELPALSPKEAQLIAELKTLEPKKKVEKDRHPEFTTINSLRVEKLSSAQLKIVAKHCTAERGMLAPPKETKEYLIPAIRKILPPNPVVQLETAIDIAQQLISEFASNYFNHMATLIRQVNEQFGTFSRDWKCWWVYNGLVRIPAHCSNDHSECGRFVAYTRCMKGKYVYIPSWRYWTDFTAEAGYPAGVKEMASLLMDAWTFGGYMADLLPSIIMYANTSTCESYFHGLDVWLPMWSHFSHWGFQLGADAWHLTFNEQKERKELTSGVIKKTKTHKERGILAADQKRSRIKLWVLQILDEIFDGEHVKSWTTARREAARRQALRRHQFVVRYEELKLALMTAYAADPETISRADLPSSIVSRAPQHTMLKKMRLTAGSGMGIGYLPVECQASPEPQHLPFPFKAGREVPPANLQAAAAAVLSGAELAEEGGDSPPDVGNEYQLQEGANADTVIEESAAEAEA